MTTGRIARFRAALCAWAAPCLMLAACGGSSPDEHAQVVQQRGLDRGRRETGLLSAPGDYASDDRYRDAQVSGGSSHGSHGSLV